MRKTHYLGIGKYFLNKTSKLLTIKAEKRIKLYPIKIKKFGSSKVRVTHSCPTLWDPMVYTVHGILQARIPENNH